MTSSDWKNNFLYGRSPERFAVWWQCPQVGHPCATASVSTLQRSTRAENGQLVCSTVLEWDLDGTFHSAPKHLPNSHTHTFTHQWAAAAMQSTASSIEFSAQGHLNMWTVAAGIRTADPSFVCRPVLSNSRPMTPVVQSVSVHFLHTGSLSWGHWCSNVASYWLHLNLFYDSLGSTMSPFPPRWRAMLRRNTFKTGAGRALKAPGKKKEKRLFDKGTVRMWGAEETVKGWERRQRQETVKLSNRSLVEWWAPL